MQIIDYFFYRKYVEYKKADDDPGFSTTWLLSAVFAEYVIIPVLVLCEHFFRIGTLTFLIICAAIVIFWMIIISRRYNKKKIREILLKYRYHKCNERIKDWMLNWGVVLICIIGFFTFGIWRYFFKCIGLI